MDEAKVQSDSENFTYVGVSDRPEGCRRGKIKPRPKVFRKKASDAAVIKNYNLSLKRPSTNYILLVEVVLVVFAFFLLLVVLVVLS